MRASDIAVIPAAAGGPKGLILNELDQWLFGGWLANAPRQRSLIGASIGAWRMATASMADPAHGFQRLADLYCRQSYTAKPSSDQVTQVLTELLHQLVHGHIDEIVGQAQHRLHILTIKGRGLLRAPQQTFSTKAGFIAATLANVSSRSHLARHMERVIFSDQRDDVSWLKTKFDAFPTEFASLTNANLSTALLASGTLPLIMDPVRHIPDAPAGTYWDGGLIDYHLALPYSRLCSQPAAEFSVNPSAPGSTNLVLYPHFTDHIIPGWLDKAFAWRRAHKGKNVHWLDNVILVAPSPQFIRSLPRQKLPDRKDFVFHGLNHAQRIQEWKQAIGASAHLRDAFAAFVENPDVRLIEEF